MQMPSAPDQRLAGAGPSGTFARKSSGLIRQVSTTDAFFYGLNAITISYLTFILFMWTYYPGASVTWSTILTVIGSVCVGVVYALFASVYPRSGGEYVFGSRVIHPLVGFMLSFSQGFWLLFYFGTNGAFMMLDGVSPMLSIVGIQTGNQTLQNWGAWCGGKWGLFVGGTIAILFIAYMSWAGNKVYFLFQRYGMIVALASTAIAIGVLCLGWAGVLHFNETYNAIAGPGAYAKIATSAPLPAFSGTQTLFFMVWPAFAILFSVGMVSFSGEIKEVRRGPLKAIVGSMLLVGIVFIVMSLAASNGVGARFFYNAPANAADMPFWPVVQAFAAVLGNNWFLTIVMMLWVILIQLFAMGTNVIYGSRAMFAWGIDGMAPKRFSSVSPNKFSPGFDILILTIAAEIILILYCFTTLITIISGLLMFSIVFLVMCLTGVVFPYIKKDVYENSPATIKVAGVPLMSICGVLGAVFCVFLLWRCFADNTAGAIKASTMYIALGVVVISLAWYLGYRSYNRKKGVNIDQRYKEIPLE
jgi:amino acid transporter